MERAGMGGRLQTFTGDRPCQLTAFSHARPKDFLLVDFWGTVILSLVRRRWAWSSFLK
jgi:hypothetical protein